MIYWRNRYLTFFFLLDLCPFDCHSDENRGICINGECLCQENWIGDACQYGKII